MSIVGPRPQVKWAVDLYSKEEHDLLTIRPGITDYSSIVFRDEGAILEGSEDPDKAYLERIAPEKIRLSLLYIHNYTFLTDVKLILATVGSIIGIDPAWALPTEERSRLNNHQLVKN